MKGLDGLKLEATEHWQVAVELQDLAGLHRAIPPADYGQWQAGV